MQRNSATNLLYMFYSMFFFSAAIQLYRFLGEYYFYKGYALNVCVKHKHVEMR
jgi:hypothetical protein